MGYHLRCQLCIDFVAEGHTYRDADNALLAHLNEAHAPKKRVSPLRATVEPIDTPFFTGKQQED
jgi:hypothetical protein